MAFKLLHMDWMTDVRRRAFAFAYEKCCTAGTDLRLAPFRAATVGSVRGNVLEIGAGTGSNLPFYDPSVALTIVEPNPHMARRFARHATQAGRSTTVVICDGENLPFEDGAFDAVVSTLVLCSVRDMSGVLSEVRRVLRPATRDRSGGTFHFFEHVASDQPRIRQVQRWLNPVWGIVADGCQLDREIGTAIRAASFSLVSLEDVAMPIGPSLTRRCILGRATR